MKYLSLIPAFCYAVIIGFAGYAASVVGHWPYYAHPDPKDLPSVAFYSIASIAFLTGFLSLIVLPVAYLGWRLMRLLRQDRSPVPGIAIILFAGGLVFWLADFAAIHFDLPWHSLLSWMLD